MKNDKEAIWGFTIIAFSLVLFYFGINVGVFDNLVEVVKNFF